MKPIVRGKQPIIIKRDPDNTVLKLMPADGNCIRFKELNKLRIKEKLGLGTLNNTLKKLESTGIIQKEFVKAKQGAGTCYRLTLPIPNLDKQGWTTFIKEHRRRVEMSKNPVEKEKALALYLTRSLENYMSIIFRTLKSASKKNPEMAEIFIEIAGKTYITNLLKDINSLISPEYLFDWDNVPGRDNARLIKFLTDYFLIVLEAKKTDIHKSDDGKTIYISKNEYPSRIMAEISIDVEKEKAVVKTIDNITHELKVKKENNKLKIYTSENKTQALEIAKVAFGHPGFQVEKARTAVHARMNREKKTDEEQKKYIKENFGFD